MLLDITKSLFRQPVTEKYPFERHPTPERLRGRLEWDATKCTGCGLCAKDCPADAIQTGLVTAFASNTVVGLRRGAIQAEAEKINLLRAHKLEDIVKQIAIGVDGNGFETHAAGIFHDGRKIGVQRRFAAKQNEIGLCGLIPKSIQPALDG